MKALWKGWPHLLSGGAALAVSMALAGGCSLVKAPAPEPTPVPPPPIKGVVFDPADGVTHFTDPSSKLNDPTNSLKPEAFRVSRVDSGELVWIQSVKTTKVGTPPRDQVTYGIPDVVHVAGILSPAPGQPGWAEAVKTAESWTMGQNVDVEQDPQYPTDLQNRRMVQIFFKGRKDKNMTYDLNRMMIRSGYATVDLQSPTSIDVTPWLNDEEYAREKRLGLWGLGIVLGQRLPPPMPKGTRPLVQQVTITPAPGKIIRPKATKAANSHKKAGAAKPTAGATATPAAPKAPGASKAPGAPTTPGAPAAPGAPKAPGPSASPPAAPPPGPAPGK